MVTKEDTEPSLRELERAAERNRTELKDTVDLLQARISPTALKHHVQDYVRNKKTNLLQSIEQKARDNPLQAVAFAGAAAYPLWSIVSRIPVPVLLIGAGLALTRSSSGRHDEGDGEGLASAAQDSLGRATDAARQKIGEVSESVVGRAERGMESARRAAQRVSEYGTQASKTAEDIAAHISAKASESADTLREMSSDAAGRAGDMLRPDQIKRAGMQASDWLDDTVTRHPLIVGAVGLAVGALIASALPSTPQEDELLGKAADSLKRRARDAVLEGAEAAKGVATEVYREAASHAREQGLSAGRAKEFAGQIGERVKTVVAHASDEGRQTAAPDGNSFQPDLAGADRREVES
jgi:hypothetical protein